MKERVRRANFLFATAATLLSLGLISTAALGCNGAAEGDSGALLVRPDPPPLDQSAPTAFQSATFAFG